MNKVVKKYTDAHTGREYYYMSIGEKITVRPYVTQQHFTNDSGSFVVGYYGDSMLYVYHIQTQQLIPLDNVKTEGSCDAVVSRSNRVYYRNLKNQIKMMDLRTLKGRIVAEPPEALGGIDAISITNDEQFISSYWSQTWDKRDFFEGIHRLRVIPRLDCHTGIWDYTTLHYEFEDPRYPSVGHPMINPADENILFFCHEGMTLDIHDRLWTADYRTGEMKNIFIQAKREDGRTGEPSGHEVWSQDGNYIYFVKFLFSQTIGKAGIVRVSRDGTQRRYINGDYLYWHCHPSNDNHWLVADTQIDGGRSEIVLVNLRTEQSTLLCNIPFAYKTPQHPYQPHPIISPDNKKVSWQMIDENGRVGCAWMDIHDLTRIEQEKGEYRLSDSASLIRYAHTKSEVENTYFEGEDCYRVAYQRGFYVKSNAMGENISIEITVIYFDWGKEPLVLYYTAGIQSVYDYANSQNAKIFIERNHTCRWISKQVRIDSVNMQKSGQFGTDFYFCGYRSEAYIKTVVVKEIK